ncbi:MAG TPA: tripartite tricarboxylate transporter substrate binding protein [Burkholderiales bacterium]|nr:tripartite tricarboxylate transporter substrate binding protein [Burkholderiales bacterium]
MLLSRYAGASLVVLSLFFPGVAAAAAAEKYPIRPVRIVIPFAAGGTFDPIGRVLAQKLTEAWGQQVVADNRPGGATILATDIVARAAPDGHTLYLSPNSLAANPALHKKLPYDSRRDLQPVVLVAAQPMALGANPSFPASTIKDLIALAKAKPGQLSYGSAGIGSGGHLAAEIFKAAAGLTITHVSYKGGNVAMLEVISNQIPLVMTGLPNLLPQQEAGKIKILAISSARRSPAAPDIPSIGETVPGYDFKNWFGLIAPAGTPKSIVARINGDVNAVLKNAEVRQRLLSQGFEVIGGSSAEFTQLIETDTAKFARALRAAGITAN